MKYTLSFCVMACILMGGCAQPRGKNVAADIARENEQRLATLEDSVQSLNSQIAQLNNRVYEVRTRNGQKTSMTVVPITPSANAGSQGKPAAPQPEPRKQPAASKKAETPKPPAAPRQITPATTPALPSEAPVAAQAGPSGRVGSSTAQLPPPQMPAESAPVTEISAPASSATIQPAGAPAPGGTRNNPIPVPQGNVPELPSETATPPVPVPLLPTSEVSLPSEQPVAASEPAAAQAAQPARASAPAKPVQGEQAAYNAALGAARSGRTAEGIRLFREYLQKYPNGRYAANADYWIGECLFAQGKYQEALSEFNQVNSAFPSHHKNADALLKAGITMNKLGDREGAAAKFRTVIANFPNSEAARRARAMGAN